MTKQRTLKEGFLLKGKGLYTDQEVHITFLPAPVDHGYKICRVDLPGKPAIDATIEHVRFTERGTVLSVNDIIQVGMFRHVLAALYSCEIDNCLIHVDAPEFPVMDGSSIEFVKKINEVGADEQDKERIYYTLGDKVEYIDEGSGAHLILLPADSFGVYVQIMFESEVLNVQSAKLNNISEFAEQIAMCRSFMFIKDVEPLMEDKLLDTFMLSHTIVVYDKMIAQKQLDLLTGKMNAKNRDARKFGYIASSPLRFQNEPARHRLLDMVGDIALMGKFIKGLIIAICPEHNVNVGFIRRISEELKLKSYHDVKNECLIV